MKKYFYLIFFSIFFADQVWSDQNKSISNLKGCSLNFIKNNPNKIDNLKIKLIEVDHHDYRKWTVNGVRILTNRYRYVPAKFKRRFNSTISVTYEDDTKCVFEGRTRHSGDEKDHIDQIQNSISQSLDIHLIDGNIKGITKFKLLRSNTRGNLEDEILVTEILRNLNYLAPRTTKVKARVNKVTTTMLFQEKAAKEMLEFNNRREAPILEADERFFFKSVSKIEDNNLSGWDMGVVPLMNKSSKYMLSKQINANILEKSHGHKAMSLNSINNLNLIYLYFSNRFQDELNNFNYFDYDLDNNLLGLYDKKKISKLDEYNLFMQATNSTHGLAANNRKFYWNSIENYFEPINYDSNANISGDIPKGSIRYPISDNFFSSFENLATKLNNLDILTLQKNIELSGLSFSRKELKKKINKILLNLQILETNYLDSISTEMVNHNKTKTIENILDKFHKNLKENHPETFLIKNNFNINEFQKCEIFLENCLSLKLKPEELSSLLEGELFKGKSYFQYLGKDFSFKETINLNTYNTKNYKNTSIYYEDGISVNIDEMNNTINIIQNLTGAKAYIIDGKLEKVKINFTGSSNKKNKKTKDFPINEKGLTGCLSLINLKLSNIYLSATNSSCEDNINFINTSGTVESIKIDNSISDGLDIDFSNLKIKNIDISSAKNDCVDFSYGIYNVEELNLSNCGDKALSVGEKSHLILTNINAKNSSIGIASKDSSTVSMKNGNFNFVDTCLSAYKKKQEFEGGIINFSNMTCNFISNEVDYDKYSLIKKLNKI